MIDFAVNPKLADDKDFSDRLVQKLREIERQIDPDQFAHLTMSVVITNEDGSMEKLADTNIDPNTEWYSTVFRWKGKIRGIAGICARQRQALFVNLQDPTDPNKGNYIIFGERDPKACAIISIPILLQPGIADQDYSLSSHVAVLSITNYTPDFLEKSHLEALQESANDIAEIIEEQLRFGLPVTGFVLLKLMENEVVDSERARAALEQVIERQNSGYGGAPRRKPWRVQAVFGLFAKHNFQAVRHAEIAGLFAQDAKPHTSASSIIYKINKALEDLVSDQEVYSETILYLRKRDRKQKAP